MKILFLDWHCFNREDTIEALKSMGHEVCPFICDGYNDRESDGFTEEFTEGVERIAPDFVFSYNYFPTVAKACHEINLPYVSFVYDSPYTYVYSYTVAFPTNYIFLFDRSWVNEFVMGGLPNVFYEVLPGRGDKIASMNKKYRDISRTKSDISFVGTLYNEQHNFYERLIEKADPYLKGYLEGVIEAQRKLYGMSIVESALTDDILERMNRALPVGEEPMGVEPKGYRYANYFIKRKITQIERMDYLNAIGEKFGDSYDIKLFTVDNKFSVKGIKNMGVAPYETEMPFVFNDSRINLNISLRSINTGIPLRCIDIMSAGGFLLSNYQADLAVDFVPGEDFDFYGDREEMLQKIEYYLAHEKERAEIASNGNKKIQNYYSFEAVFNRMLDRVFGEDNG